MSRHTIAPQYEWSILKEYDYWTLLLFDEPTPFIGKAVVWLAREGGMQRYSQLSVDELQELQQVLKEYEQALAELWQPDHMNYMWLGNLIHEHGGHGHMHVFPRYKEPREFDGVQFVDARYGQFHKPFEKPAFIREQMEKVRDTLREQLGTLVDFAD
jgi:diadenosine tetraphosphate (Ap4A) HIT family hydrolase